MELQHELPSARPQPGHAQDRVRLFHAEHYENRIPDFAEAELERLYGNSFSSLLYFQCMNAAGPQTCTYVARDGAAICVVLLYRREGSTVRVLNQRIVLDEAALDDFAAHVFHAYPGVHAIVLDAVHASLDRISYPYLEAGRPADLVIPLPPSENDYLASLGKNTRRNIKRYMDKLTTAHPDFRFHFQEGRDAKESEVREIIHFNKERTLARNDVYYRSEEDIGRIMAMVRRYGVVGLAWIGSELCAGTVGYQIGENFIYIIIAHKPVYNQYSVGMLSSYLTVCEAIRRGCKEFNFVSGNNDYKRFLGAQMRELRHIALFRSSGHMLLKSCLALKTWAAGINYRLTFTVQERLHELQRQKRNGEQLDFRSGVLFHAFSLLRGGRHLLSRIAVSLK